MFEKKLLILILLTQVYLCSALTDNKQSNPVTEATTVVLELLEKERQVAYERKEIMLENIEYLREIRENFESIQADKESVLSELSEEKKRITLLGTNETLVQMIAVFRVKLLNFFYFMNVCM
jgi:hypothetical protein